MDRKRDPSHSAKAKEELATQLDKASPQSSHPGHQVSGSVGRHHLGPSKLIHPVLHRGTSGHWDIVYMEEGSMESPESENIKTDKL